MPGLLTVTGVSLAADGALNGAYSFFDPITDIFTYFCPPIVRLFSNVAKVTRKKSEDADSQGLLRKERIRILKEVNELASLAGVKKVQLCQTASRMFSSYGGRFSFATPVLIVPGRHLVGANMKITNHDGTKTTVSPGNFGVQDSKYKKELNANYARYNDHETRFQILRSLHQIEMNDSMHKWVAKVAMVAAIVLLKVGIFFWPISLAILLVAVIAYFIIDRYTQGNLDEAALKSLIQYCDNHKIDKKEAIDAAFSVIRKTQQHNLERLKGKSRFTKLLIDAEGNERFNITAPSFSRRLEKLETLRAQLLASVPPPLLVESKLKEEGHAPPAIWSDLQVEEALGMN